MKFSIAGGVALLLLSSQSGAQVATSVTRDSRTQLRSFVEKQGRAPEDYVISKFATYDLVLIGEPHWVHQHVTFVQGLIPQLYRNHVYTLAIEFARRVDQPLIDSLVTRPSYDEQLARKLTFQFLVTWGYQEYVDLYRAAWELNHSLPAGARRFRILALNGAPKWSVIKTEAEFDDWRIRRAAVGCEGGEDQWAKLLIDSVLSKNEKALVYTGMHHAFTKYAQPIVSQGKLLRKEDERFGQYLFAYAPQRVFMIALHQTWPGLASYDAPRALPADGAIDATLASLDKKYRRVGFDLNGTPMGALVSPNTVYSHGYEPFTIDKMADGYIVLGPIAEYEPVHAIADFITEANIEDARSNSAHPEARGQSVKEFNDGIRSALEVVEEWRKIGQK